MEKKITLQALADNELQEILKIIHSDEILNETFGSEKDRISRLLNVSYAAIIKENSTTVGFIMTTDLKVNNIHEVDLGILSKYRNMGYGSEALKLLKEKIIEQQITPSIQISKINIPAIKIVTKNGFTQYNADEKYNYYSLDIKQTSHTK